MFAENEKISEESVISWYASICRGAEKPLFYFRGRAGMDIIDEDMDISLALQYWYKTGSKEVIKFNEKEFIDKAAVEKKNSVLQRKIMDGHRFITTAGLNEDNLGNEAQLNMMTSSTCWIGTVPLPTASPASSTIRWDKHAGYESC